MFCSSLKNEELQMKESKSGHPRMQTPIMLCFKARGIHTAPPGNSYNLKSMLIYINFVVTKWEIKLQD